jgi:hypothetical protein
MNAPIALFAYRRPGHLQRCLESLASNPEAADSVLSIYVDGPRCEREQASVEATRAVARSAKGFARVDCVFRERNLGLSASIIQGVTEQLALNGELIVVEDDLVVSPFFLRYMNDGLRLYRGVEELACIHGYVYPVEESLPETFLLRGADCWGWATWSRAWALFNPDGAELLRQLEERGLSGAFDFDGAAAYCDMLRAQIQGRNDSWAVRWHASAFLAERLTLYPGRSLVCNCGNDGSGTHDLGRAAEAVASLAASPLRVEPLPLVENPEVRAILGRYFRQTRAGGVRGWVHRLLGLLRRLVR